MPVYYLRRLSGKDRSKAANRQLGLTLALVAGAANAGGFLAVKRYTSHMTGIVSAMADDAVLGDLAMVLAGMGALLAFVAGAACSAILINWARRKEMQSEYALSLLLEAVLLLCFGLVGGRLEQHVALDISMTVMLLTFIMGLQNAIITKISLAEIRTTHVTGLVTDMGIELGKLLYWNLGNRHSPDMAVRANRDKLKLHASLLLLFFLGGVAGAFGFKQLGFLATIPLAALLWLIAIVPVMDDLRTRWQRP